MTSKENSRKRKRKRERERKRACEKEKDRERESVVDGRAKTTCTQFCTTIISSRSSLLVKHPSHFENYSRLKMQHRKVKTFGHKLLHIERNYLRRQNFFPSKTFYEFAYLIAAYAIVNLLK